MASVETPVDTMGSLDKLQTANMARLMGDNQRVLDQTNRRAEAFARWEAKQVLGEEMPEPADEMQISIDSPVTTTHHHQTPAASGIGKALVGAAIAAGLIGIPAAGMIGYGVSQLRDRAPAATDDNTLDIGLGRIEDLKE